VLRHTTIEKVQAGLTETFGLRLKRRPDIGGLSEVEITSSTKRVARLTFDPQASAVRIAGPQSLVAQMDRLIRAFDSEQTDRAARIVPLRRADSGALKAALDAFQQGYRSR